VDEEQNPEEHHKKLKNRGLRIFNLNMKRPRTKIRLDGELLMN
jgi:hypothetical protein